MTAYIYYRLFLGVEKAPINTAPGRFLRSDGRFLRSEGRVGQGMVGVDCVWWWGSMKMLGFTSIPLIAVSRALVTVSTPLVTVLRYLVTVCS